MEHIKSLVELLLGSCHSIEEACAMLALPELSESELYYLETEIFQCEACNWWYPNEDYSHFEKCVNCVQVGG